jgi:PhnB protein
MANHVKAIPDGYHSITLYLSIRGASEAIGFYKQAFGAQELVRMDMPGGKVGHAELKIGDSLIMLADEFPEHPDSIARSPKALGGTTFGVNLYVEEVDVWFKRAVDAGAKVLRPLTDKFYGDRSGTVEDPFGHVWTVSTHVEDVSAEEMKKRMAALPQS